jgi:hypothetical protein
MFGSDPIERIREGLAALAGEDRRGWSGAARSARLVELLEAAERLQAETLRCVGEWDAQADWALDGAVSPRSWLAYRVPVARVAASRLVGAARLAREHAATGAALAEGSVSCAHVEVLAPMIRGREAEYATNEDTLLDAAKELRADDFAVVARHWRGIADDCGEDARRQFERRGLGVSTTLRGMGVVDGELDPEATELLLEALDLAAPPDKQSGPEPPRTLRQRRADGLADVCAAYLAANGKGGRAGAGLDLLMDHHTAAGHDHDDPRHVRCELARVGPVPLETAQRLACDCAVGRVVMRGPSEVLDLGRRERLVPPALRRALDIRDRGCAWPGCDRPAEWCDAHHIVWWERGGATDLENCCLLCRRHHVLCHEGGWAIRREPDGTYAVQEPPVTFVRTRRRGRAPPVAA